MASPDAPPCVERPDGRSGGIEPARWWRVAATALCTDGLWDIQRAEFAAAGAAVVGHHASGSAGEGYEPERAFTADSAWWGGRPADDGRCFLGVEFDQPVVPSSITLLDAPGEHRARQVRIESSEDGVAWSAHSDVEFGLDQRSHVAFSAPAAVAAAPAWRLVTRSAKHGFAWDIHRIRLLRNGSDLDGSVTASGSAGPGFGIECAAVDDDTFWGGRHDDEGRFHVTITGEGDLELDRIVLDQGSEHWARAALLERRADDGSWRAFRHFGDLRPGHNELLLYASPSLPEPIEEVAHRRPRPGRFDDRRILVLIAAYRDLELPNTIESALAQAAYPEHVRFAICHQVDDETRHLLDRWVDDPRFTVDEVEHSESRGCCWARNRTFGLCDGEPYVLQVDAHMRFAARWDVRYIDMLESIDAELPILTTYPPRYTLDADGAVSYDLTAGVQRLYVDEVRDDLTTLQKTSPPPDLSRPGRSPSIAAGQLFTRGSFCRDVPYDPDMYFAGEEISLAARAFTSGYDLYCPNENLVWHLYDHDHPKHWDDHDDHSEHHDGAIARLRELFRGGPGSLGEYGLGSVRTLAEFEDHAGIDLGATRVATDGSVTIDIDRSVIEPRDDYAVFIVVFLDRDGSEVDRHEVRAPDVLELARSRVRISGVDGAASRFAVVPVTRRGTIGEIAVRRLSLGEQEDR